MAIVYKAVQESLNRTIALKELDLSRFRSEPTVLERFRLEARSAAALEHPGIITIYDLWEDENKAYIAMEYIDGVELKEVLVKQAPLDPVSATLIALEVCGALHYAHGRGMIHRDVKPGNIMLSRKGNVRLTDFGIVSVSGTGDLTVTGQVLGTPAYMSPEQIAGEKLGPSVDMFSLGVILYEMLAGRRPFSGENQLALIQQIMRSEPVPPSRFVGELPEGLSEAVLRCLAKEPESRYASMEELAAALNSSLPPGSPSRETCVSNLVAQTFMEKQAESPPGMQVTEETSIHRPAQGVRTEDGDKMAVTGGTETVVSENGSGEPEFTMTGSEYSSPYSLEMDPPADLPPLDLSGSGTDAEPEAPPSFEQEEIPLSLKELPPDEPEEKKKASMGFRWRYLLWGLIPLVLVIGAAVWKYSGAPIPTRSSIQELLPESVKSASGPTLLSVVAGQEVSIIMDGEPLGDVKTSRMFEVEPGLHKIEAVNPRLGTKSFIVEIEPGQMVEIRVEWEGE
jgi:serine/threonine protein kinase